MKLIFILLFICSAGWLKANDSIKFVVLVPDTVEIGKPMKVTYHLYTNEYRDIEYPKFVNFDLRRYSSLPFDSYYNQSVFREFEWSMELTPYKTGNIDIPPMKITAGGQQITSSPKNVFVKGKSSAQQNIQLVALNKFWASSKDVYSPQYHPKPSSPGHTEEMEIGKQFLREKGQHRDNIWLREIFSNGDLVMFSDEWNLCFVITATKKYEDKLDHLVLAYSMESSLQIHQELVLFYTRALNSLLVSTLNNKNLIRYQDYAMKNHVKPLLGNIGWGSGMPYNNLMPIGKDNKNMDSGQTAVALAQLMAYYKYPQQLRGHHYYKVSSNSELSMDFSKIKLNWNQYKDHYSEKEINSLASQLISACAVAVETEWPDVGYTRCTGMRNFKAALTNYFGYSNKSVYVDGASDEMTLTLLYNELESGRPVLAHGINTYFVCDGYDECYFHVNMGAKRYLNGYYRILLSCKPNESSAMVHSMIIGIAPDSRNEVSKEVTLNKPGMLDELLSKEEKENVTHLVVKGKLNGEDMKIIRQMAGAVDNEGGTSYHSGVLRQLDLGQATFVTDKDHPYLRKDGSGYTYTQTSYYEGIMGRTETKTIDMKHATKDELREVRNSGLMKGKGYRFGGGGNSDLYIDFTMKKGVVTPFLFEGCDNLQAIILPKDVKEIEDGAFAYCNSLIDIILPSKVYSVSEGSFMYCYNLEYVYYESDLFPKEKEGIHYKMGLNLEDSEKGILRGAFAGNNPSTCKGFKKYIPGQKQR